MRLNQHLTFAAVATLWCSRGSSAAHVVRQEVSGLPQSTPAPSSSASVPTSMPVATSIATPVSVGQLTFTLASTNPSAVPLPSLVSNAPIEATPTLNAAIVPTPGATPPVTGAPVLPQFVFKASEFPPLDKIPPLDSPQVKQWLQEVQDSGVTIPTFSPTIAGGCPNNTDAAKDTSRCWWTCGQCTRETDITTCPDKLTWGLSFDDGPSPYTPTLLNYMNENAIKSTFFIVGSRAISRPDILQAEYMAGHQLSVHTWSHPVLTTLKNEEIVAELGWTREAIRQITGVSPNTFRPPYGDVDDRVRAIATAMGLTNIIWTGTGPTNSFDTNDWHIPSGQSPVSVLETFHSILETAPTLNTGFIVLAHDLYQQTVDLAVGYVLPDAIARRNPQFALKPIITCLNRPLSDAYAETSSSKTESPGSGAFSSNSTQTGGDSGSSGKTPASSQSGTGYSTIHFNLLLSLASLILTALVG